MRVQVCYALPDRVFLRDLTVAPGTTVKDAVLASGVLNEFPNLALDDLKLGIFGKLRTLDTEVRDRDRIEIYRPLVADPKDARRRRAVKDSRRKKTA